MRFTKEALATKVVVRRAKTGTTRYVWEINCDNIDGPVCVSPDTFANMEAAYSAGKARLAEFIPSPLPPPTNMVENPL